MQEEGPTRASAKPNWVMAVALRTASLAVGYGLWSIARWLYLAKPLKSTLGLCLLIVASLLSGAFLILGILAPDKAVRTVWKAIGKVILYALIFT